MLGRAHMAIGGAVGLALVSGRAEIEWWAVPVAIIAAGLPDVLDSENAAGRDALGLSWSSVRRTMRRRNKSAADLVLVPVRTLGALALDVFARALPHRGVTHWLLTWFLLSALAVEVSVLAGGGTVVAVAFCLGYLSHLLADSLTRSGLKLFAPLYDRSIHLLPSSFRFRYDSPVQWFVVAGLYGAVLAWRHPHLVQLLEGVTP